MVPWGESVFLVREDEMQAEVMQLSWATQSMIVQAKKKGIVVEFTPASPGGFHRAVVYYKYDDERKVTLLQMDPHQAIERAIHTLEYPTSHEEGEQ